MQSNGDGHPLRGRGGVVHPNDCFLQLFTGRSTDDHTPLLQAGALGKLLHVHTQNTPKDARNSPHVAQQ